MALIALGACTSDQETPAPEQQVRLAIDGRRNANPSIAANPDLVAVTWSASTKDSTDVYIAVSRDTGRTFGTPARVNDIPGDARINSEFPPRVVLVPHAGATPEVVVVWTTRRNEGNRLEWSKSIDGGATFSPAMPVPGSIAPGNRGWQSVAVNDSGRVFVMWLDHRDVPAMAAEHHHGTGAAASAPASAKDDPTARAAFSKLYFTSLSDTGAKSITGGVCYCCKTSLVARGANIYGVWRHVYPGTARDMALAVSRDGGRTFAAPVRVHEDGWKIDGCPENGPALAVDDGGKVHVAWVTPPDGKPDTPLGLFYATSPDGAAFGPRLAIPTAGPAAHTQIVADSAGAVMIAWDELAGTTRNVGLARLTPNGASPTIDRIWKQGAVEGGWPVLAVANGSPIVAWVSGITSPFTSITVQRIGAR